MSKQLLLGHKYVSLENCHSKCVCNTQKYSNKEYIDVIMTFGLASQMHFEIKVPHKLSEEEFIGFIIKSLNKKKLMDLIKISLNLCMHKGIHCYDYIFQNNGKYYFNIDMNNDPETHKWNNYRNKLVEEGNDSWYVSRNAIIKYKNLNIPTVQNKFNINLLVLLIVMFCWYNGFYLVYLLKKN